MFFEREDASVVLLDVLLIDQKRVSIDNPGRTFDALSFRLEADTRLITEHATFFAGTDSVCYFPARVRYTRESRRDKMIVVHFNGMNLPTGQIQIFQPRDPKTLQALCWQLLERWQGKEKGYRYACTAIFYRILEELCCQSEGENAPPPILAPGVKYIGEHFSDPEVSVKAAAEHCHVSEVYFRKLFKSHFGVSPRRYIIELRIKHGANLIESGYYTLGEVATRLGYTDYKYFSTEFGRIMGMPPSRYRYSFTGKDLNGE